MTISLDPAGEAATVRTARALEAGRLARTLALAFYDDPVFDWFAPRRPGRFDRMVRFFRGISLERSTLRFGHVYTTDSIAGAALWLPPGEAHSSTAESLRMLPELLRATGRDIVRAMRCMTLLEQQHPHEDHWYLMFAGVAPEWRGAGLGTALMQPILERADAEGMPAYLDATSPRNRRLYERHGFETIREIHLPKGPPMWPMWREPR